MVCAIGLTGCRGEVAAHEDATLELADGGPRADAARDSGSADSGGTDASSLDAGSSDAFVASPSGEAMPVGDIPGWRQIFADDFLTDVPFGSFPSAVSAKWSAYPDGWKDTSKNGTYFPSKVISIQGGVMTLHLHTESGVHMVSAPEPKLPGATGTEGGLLYGRYVIRFRADAVPGYKTAWLLWPDSEVWPRDGEIDFPEGNLDSTISAFMHRQQGSSGGDQDAYPTAVIYASWHTAVIEWTAASCKFLLDGTLIGTSTSRIPKTPMHWVIQTETALDGTVPSDSAAGDVQIDWAVVYVPG
jgi:beta-glucanase (GH16 family)